jgi:GNAT superfamily N-acetyltransferase
MHQSFSPTTKKTIKIMVTIIRANQTHLEELAVLFDGYRVFYEQESDLEGAKSFLAERMQLDESVILAAQSEGKLVGFTQLYPLFSSVSMQRSWLLNDLFVDKSQRGKGVSKLLMNAAKEHARQTGAKGLTLETDKANVEGNGLYPAVGFTLDEGHNYYYWTV